MSGIGVMGGTFDPIHYGHLAAAEGVRHDFQLDEVWFVPAGHPPHKTGHPITPARQRYEMAVLATVSNPRYRVSSVELDRPGPSYTVDTLREIRSQIGPSPELYFITGADAILQILTWKGTEDMLRMARFVAVTRPGYAMRGLEDFLRQLPAPWRERIVCHPVPLLAISSSDLRERVRQGRPVKYLLPEPVESYIYKKGLYKASAGLGL